MWSPLTLAGFRMGPMAEPPSLALRGTRGARGEREKPQSRSTGEPSAPELAFMVVIVISRGRALPHSLGPRLCLPARFPSFLSALQDLDQSIF